jgi:outer membrane protein, multidrug efflux system
MFPYSSIFLIELLIKKVKNKMEIKKKRDNSLHFLRNYFCFLKLPFLASIFSSKANCAGSLLRKIISFIIFLSLAGCMLGPDYHRPCLDIPEAFHYEIREAQDSLNLEWWTQFEDPVLEELILQALANNKDVKIAAANIENALGVLIQTRSQLFPQIGYTGSYNRFRNSETLASTALPAPFSIPNPQTIWQALLTGSWQIDIWGRIRRQTEAARAEVYATYEARQEVILSLVSAVANSYIQLRGFDEQLAISLRTRDSYAAAVKYFELQYKYGQESKMALAQAKTQYETASAKIPQIRSQIAQTENGISILLGKNPGPIPRGKSIYDLKLPSVPADLPSELLCQRPDIMQAEQELIAANAQIGAAIALYFPSISLTGVYGNASQQLNNLFTGPSSSWNFTGTVSGPIFTGGSIYGQVLQAEAGELAALISYEKSVQNAFADVEDALVAHTMLIEQLAAEGRLVEAAGEYQHLAMLQYKGGYAPYFIVIQAQEQYYPAELAWAETRAQLFNSLVNIYQAMGGGWVLIAEEKTGS